MGEHGDPHENMHKHMMQMMGEHGDPHENMHKHMMQMMHGHGGEHGGWSPHHGEQEVPEVIQFMQELGMLGEVAAHLEEGQSVALLGIHMIRDNLEGDLQIDSLTAIVEEAASGSPARNAALIVAIQALQDAGDDEAAAELMVELVLSN